MNRRSAIRGRVSGRTPAVESRDLKTQSLRTRREAIRLGAAGLLAFGLCPPRLFGEETASTDGFSFIAVNDLHFSDAACQPWFDKVVADIKLSTPQAEFCLLGGDLADLGTTEQLSGIRDAFRKLGIPIYTVIGNHDYRSHNDRSTYEEIFPRQINYRFEHRGWQLIGLDTSEGTKSKETLISETTLHWLDANVPQLDREKPTIIFTHFPLGESVFARPLNADAVLQRVVPLNLRAAFSGHFHGFTERRFDGAVLTTDRCCSRIRNNHDGTPEKGWFVCQAARGEVSRKFVQFQP